eukprot:scaffold24.g2992.t1
MRGSVLRVLGAIAPSLRLPLGAGAAALIAARGAKKTTGIVGLPVDEQAREHLAAKLQEVLDALAAIPEGVEYRTSVEKTVSFKLGAVTSDASDAELEDMFSRQLEEEIKLCNEELGLIPKMAEWKPWEVPEDHKIEILEETAVDAKLGGTTFASPPPPPGV